MKTFLKPLFFLLAAMPALQLAIVFWRAWQGDLSLLGPDPAKTLALETGEWAIRLLILALAITPLRYVLNMPALWSLRRMSGLFALFYVLFHFFVFLVFILGLDFAQLAIEVAERPYISLGFIALLLLILLGVTSTNNMRRRLARRWKQLHRTVYVVNILAVLHVIWIVRSSIADAVLYAVLVLLLLSYRVLFHYSISVRRWNLPSQLIGPEKRN
jgi:sulfoxide reductase heme-binding subunit YedZ